MTSSYSARWLKRKWVIVKKRSSRSPITETDMRFRTKKQAQKEIKTIFNHFRNTHARKARRELAMSLPEKKGLQPWV